MFEELALGIAPTFGLIGLALGVVIPFVRKGARQPTLIPAVVGAVGIPAVAIIAIPATFLGMFGGVFAGVILAIAGYLAGSAIHAGIKEVRAGVKV